MLVGGYDFFGVKGGKDNGLINVIGYYMDGKNVR